MNHGEREYFSLCRRLIEEKLQFEKEDGTLRQRDLEYLADAIEEKSGIRLSLSTLKRLWKKEYDHTPHPSTLQALVSVIGYKDWQDFKLHQSALSPAANGTAKKKPLSINRWMILPALAVLAIVFWLIAFRSRSPKPKPVVKGAITFTGNKTVTQGVPNTVIFNYDVSNVEADSFFLQQSWNDKERVRLDPKGHYHSAIYYYPGFHRAKLIANDSIIKKFRVHITTDGWMPLLRYSMVDQLPIYIKNVQKIEDGNLHITRRELVASKLDVEKDFVVSYYNIREFENTQSDNFVLDTRIKCDSLNTLACPGFEIVILTEEHIFYVRLMGKGCEKNVAVKMGEVARDGSNSDLSAFGRNLYQWQTLQVKTANKQSVISIDGQPVYNINFKNNFGKIVGLTYNFIGTGAVDYVKLTNGDNKIVYEDQFDK